MRRYVAELVNDFRRSVPIAERPAATWRLNLSDTDRDVEVKFLYCLPEKNDFGAEVFSTMDDAEFLSRSYGAINKNLLSKLEKMTGPESLSRIPSSKASIEKLLGILGKLFEKKEEFPPDIVQFVDRSRLQEWRNLLEKLMGQKYWTRVS